MDPNAPNAHNQDESKANIYTNYPNPLIFKNGTPVKSKQDWDKRRAEIAEDFDREVYGRTPNFTPTVTWKIIDQKDATLGTQAVTTKRLIGIADNSICPEIKVEIDATLTLPRDAKSAPVVVCFGFNFGPRNPNANQTPSPPPEWQTALLAKGWGFCILTPTTAQADNGAGLTKGIIGLTNRGQLRKSDDWGTLKAWGWSASRVLDYLETDPQVNAKRVAIEGLSRYGKAALVTMAYDTRFSLAFVGSSGAGGAKLWRRNFGETEGNIASSGEYHWMTPNFLKYAADPLTPADLPVDSHQLIALCAPSPVFIGVGSPKVEGTWVDARGMFLATTMATPVYQLLGKTGPTSSEMPSEGTPLTETDLAYSQHTGGHTNVPNWPNFIKWASRYWQ